MPRTFRFSQRTGREVPRTKNLTKLDLSPAQRPRNKAQLNRRRNG